MTTVDEETAPEQEAVRKGGTPTREYVVLEQVVFDETDIGEVEFCWIVAHRVEARNGMNALRKAFKELRVLRSDEAAPFDEGTLVCIPAGQWKPTPVRAKKRESITVDVG